MDSDTNTGKEIMGEHNIDDTQQQLQQVDWKILPEYQKKSREERKEILENYEKELITANRPLEEDEVDKLVEADEEYQEKIERWNNMPLTPDERNLLLEQQRERFRNMNLRDCTFDHLVTLRNAKKLETLGVDSESRLYTKDELQQQIDQLAQNYESTIEEQVKEAKERQNKVSRIVLTVLGTTLGPLMASSREAQLIALLVSVGAGPILEGTEIAMMSRKSKLQTSLSNKSFELEELLMRPSPDPRYETATKLQEGILKLERKIARLDKTQRIVSSISDAVKPFSTGSLLGAPANIVLHNLLK
jgi:putative sterol carrier protein